jgi:cell division FtsZ-interacting protein ZapD
LRVSIDHILKAFPEISVGRHFLSVRFYAPDIDKRPVQYNENLNFTLEYCN